VRAPEQGTRPKLFYLGAESASLTPDMQERRGGYLFSQVGSIPSPGAANRAIARPAPPVTAATDGLDLLALARTVYDVAHPARPWGWRVGAYLWTKSIAAGAFLVAALGLVGGLLTADGLTGLAVPAIGQDRQRHSRSQGRRDEKNHQERNGVNHARHRGLRAGADICGGARDGARRWQPADKG